MHSPRQRPPVTGTRTALDRAESALIGQYGDLTRLAYLTLPVSLGRHRRVLLAHGIVQRALPGVRGRLPAPRRPEAGGDGAGAPVSEGRRLRQHVVRAALARERRPRGWPAALPPPGTLLPGLPLVWGLRLFPAAGGAEDMALGRLLATAPAEARAAFLLLRLDGLPVAEVREVLTGAGVRDPEGALRAADELGSAVGEQAERLLRSREFDACFVQTRPTDLLRRRRRLWCAWGTLAALVGFLALWALPGPGQDPSPAGAGTDARAGVPVPGPRQLTRTPADVWADTSRVDFTAWPARGDRVDDHGLLSRALSVWARPPRSVRPAVAPDTPAEPPTRSPQLLYAGEVEGRAVVLFHDVQRIVRYSEPLTSGTPSLAIARADDADVTTAAAVVVARGRGTVRFLTAPWIAGAETRDLLRPDSPARRLRVAPDGVTGTVPAPAARTACDSVPVLQLRSSARIVEKHAFLLSDLGGLSPVHLTYTPLPGTGTGAPPSRQPREATGAPALVAWARLGCGLREVRGSGVRAVNVWDFAAQDLPEHGGRSVWSCVRASTWRGPGDVVVRWRTPDASAPARVVARARSTAACSRFGQHVVAGTRWRAGSAHWYVLAAGSRAVSRIEVAGDVTESRAGRTLAVRTPEKSRTRVTVSGVLTNGDKLMEIGRDG
ncbi:hypothetical protein ABZS84_17810 [Streptomyces sp. NPDC005481]|uniref:hypothetical protein n=1 Tax=Streptomyces sp. NPDC005481 TaxID=3154881 RepID=UPI00339E1215